MATGELREALDAFAEEYYLNESVEDIDIEEMGQQRSLSAPSRPCMVRRACSKWDTAPAWLPRSCYVVGGYRSR